MYFRYPVLAELRGKTNSKELIESVVISMLF